MRERPLCGAPVQCYAMPCFIDTALSRRQDTLSYSWAWDVDVYNDGGGGRGVCIYIIKTMK